MEPQEVMQSLLDHRRTYTIIGRAIDKEKFHLLTQFPDTFKMDHNSDKCLYFDKLHIFVQRKPIRTEYAGFYWHKACSIFSFPTGCNTLQIHCVLMA